MIMRILLLMGALLIALATGAERISEWRLHAGVGDGEGIPWREP